VKIETVKKVVEIKIALTLEEAHLVYEDLDDYERISIAGENLRDALLRAIREAA